MNQRKIAFILMCLLVCLWGLDYVAAKGALDVLEPMNLLFLKYGVGLLLILAIKLKQDRKTIVRAKDIPFFILCSIFGEILYFYCEYSAIDYMPVSLITIILSFVPIVSMILDRIIYKHKFSLKIFLGIVICIIGVAIVIGADFRILLQGRLTGYMFAFGAVLSWNAYNFITAKVSENYTSVTMSFNQLFCTILLLAPYAIHTMPPAEVFTADVVGEVVYLGLGSAGIGFLIMVNGLRHLGPTISAMFSNFMPVTTTIFGWVFLGEAIGPLQLLGGVIVIVSSCIVIAEKGKMEEQSNGRKAEPDDVN